MNFLENRIVRALLGLSAVALLTFVVSGYFSDYRAASSGDNKRGEASEDTTATPPIDEVGEETDPVVEEPAAPQPKTLTVLIDGLNLRKEPRRESKSLQGLGKGDTLTVISETDEWLEVETQDGKRGWISANPAYTKIKKR